MRDEIELRSRRDLGDGLDDDADLDAPTDHLITGAPMDYSHRQRNALQRHARRDADGAPPGKHTLTQHLYPQRDDTEARPGARAAGGSLVDVDTARHHGLVQFDPCVAHQTVQRKANGGATPARADDDVHALAGAGIRGSGGELPHLEAIQRSFGHHDVSQVVSHVGGEAADAARAIGARAYASGTHVAFSSAPDLHLAAHEAAHVVQQRGGVQLSGGIGAEADPHEQAADEVASAVVAGASAESMLDRYARPAGSSTSTTGVQMNREETFSEEEAGTVEAEGEQALATSVDSFLQQVPEWIELINQRTNEHTQGGQLTDIDPVLSRVVANYRRARGIHERKVSAAEAVLASEMALASMILGVLPGLGDVTGMMSVASPFMREVEMLVPDGSIAAGIGTASGNVLERRLVGTTTVGRGPEAAAAVLNRPLASVQRQATSRITAPLTTAPTVDPTGESGDAFALRAEQSKTAALRALLRCTQLGSNLAQVAHVAQELPAALRGGNATPDQRNLARSISQLRGQWSTMQTTIMSLTHGVDTARERMRLIQPVWSPAQLEVYLWLLWMSNIPQSGGIFTGGDDLVDADPVENRLQALGIIGPGSITGVDFGSFTTPSDQAEAVQAARRHQRMVLHALETYGAVRLGGPG